MLYLTCTTITSIDLAHYGVSRAKDWVSVKCGSIPFILFFLFLLFFSEKIRLEISWESSARLYIKKSSLIKVKK